MTASLAASAAATAWATGAGVGQLLFAGSPAAGALLLLGLALLAPGAALLAAVGCALATVVARARGYPAADWARGLYGYSGALVGLFWGVLFEPDPVALLALVSAAVASAPLTRLAHRLLTPREIPALALPALVLAWAATPFLDPIGADTGGWPLAGWTLILGALLVASRLLAAAALLGASVGLAVSLGLTAGVEPAILANAVPAAVALGSVFLPFSPAALALGGGAAALAGALWWAAAPAAPTPLLVAPFTAVTTLALVALRVPGLRQRLPGRPAPLPLASVGSPEAVRAGWAAHRRLGALVAGARQVSVLTGAGISTAAGIPDVRGPAGLGAWSSPVALDDFLASASARARYWREEEAFLGLVRRARPAAAHRALAALYRQGRITAVVTQNVDRLLQAAGLPDAAVIELHGSVHRAECVDCGHTVPRDGLSPLIAAGRTALYCERCQGLLKGGGVLFGQPVALDALAAMLRALLASDLLLVLGTSLTVAPATELLRWAREAGIPVAIVNAAPTPWDAEATVSVIADVGAVLEDLVADPATPAAEVASPGGTAAR